MGVSTLRRLTVVRANPIAVDRSLLQKNVFSSKRGYVLDGYPKTVKEANLVFKLDDVAQPDANKLPSKYYKSRADIYESRWLRRFYGCYLHADLVVCLKQTPRLDDTLHSDVDGNDFKTTAAEAATTTTKSHLVFSDVNTTFSSDSNINLAQTATSTAKPILKKSVAASKTKRFTETRQG